VTLGGRGEYVRPPRDYFIAMLTSGFNSVSIKRFVKYRRWEKALFANIAGTGFATASKVRKPVSPLAVEEFSFAIPYHTATVF
jgi:hypothetical protein